MDYIQVLQKNIQNVNDSYILSLIQDEYFNLEDKMSDLNLKQIEQHEGFDDKELKIDTWNGEYSGSTQSYADRQIPYPSLTKKPAGEKYNFLWSGDFRKGFGLRKDGENLELFSSGAYSTRTLGKTSFFQSYENMFGLNTENSATIESEVLYYVLEKTFLKIFK